jgi:hypothetical protein
MYEGPDRRSYKDIPEEFIEHIADRAAERALEKVYEQVGRAVLRKIAWAVGLIALAIAGLLSGGHLFR